MSADPIWLARAERAQLALRLGLQAAPTRLLGVLLEHDTAPLEALLAASASKSGAPRDVLSAQLAMLRRALSRHCGTSEIVSAIYRGGIARGGHARGVMGTLPARGYRLSQQAKALLSRAAGPDPEQNPSFIPIRREWGLTDCQADLAEALINPTPARPYVRQEHTRFADLKVSMHQLRAKLSRFGIVIESRYGRGYRIAAESRAKLLAQGMGR